MRKNLLFISLFILTSSAFSSTRLSRWCDRHYLLWNSSRTIAFKAVRNNDLPTFARMLKNGVDANAVDKRRGFLLRYTAEKGRLEMLRILLRKGVPVKNNNLKMALEVAAKKGRLDICLELLKTGMVPEAEYWGSSVNNAVREGNYAVVEMLLNAGADINSSIYNIPLHVGVRKRRMEIVELLLDKGAKVNVLEHSPFGIDGISALALAVSGEPRSRIAMTKILLNAGAKANLYNEKVPSKTFPLYLAVKTGNADLVELLLKHKAEVNKKILLKNKIVTPLSLAIENKYPDVAGILLKYGARAAPGQLAAVKEIKLPENNFLKKPYSYEAVKRAIASGKNMNIPVAYRKTFMEEIFSAEPDYYFNIDIAALLLKHGALNKNYALQYAISKGNIAGVKLLLENGADPTVICKDAPELNSIMALSKNATVILPLLLKAGVDVRYRDHNGDNLLSKYYYRFKDSIVFETLIKSGFDWNNVNKNGESVAEVIIKTDKSGICDSNIKILLKYGADRKKIRELAEKYDRKNLLFLLDNVWKKK